MNRYRRLLRVSVSTPLAAGQSEWVRHWRKAKVLGISKHGNSYLRRLFVQCSRSIVRFRDRPAAPFGAWLKQLMSHAHQSVAVVALANKLLRIAWAVLFRNERYRSPTLNAA
jgi:hypothetical protein